MRRGGTLNHEDVLREITTIGAGHAAAALSIIYSKPVYLSFPDVKMIEVGKIMDIQPEDSIIAQSKISISGDCKALAFMIAERKNFPMAVSSLSRGREKVTEKEDFTVSVLVELATILFGGFFSALGNFLLKPVIFSPPKFERINDRVINEIKAMGYSEKDKLYLAKSSVNVRKEGNSSFDLDTIYFPEVLDEMMLPFNL
jgi:chemotaxis protein CheY-P-specific phosphatase CheC